MRIEIVPMAQPCDVERSGENGTTPHVDEVCAMDAGSRYRSTDSGDLLHWVDNSAAEVASCLDSTNVQSRSTVPHPHRLAALHRPGASP